MFQRRTPPKDRLWHVEVMFARLRLLLMECDPDVGEVMSDVDGLVALKHRIASPIAIRVGIELLTLCRNPDLPRAIKLSNEIDRYLPYTFGDNAALMREMLDGIDQFRKSVWMGEPIRWPKPERLVFGLSCLM